MAKIYEAIKVAQQERDARGETQVGRLPANATSSAALREKLLAVYQAIYAAFPSQQNCVVAFMGSKPGEGTSSLARAFSRFVSAEMGKRVLLLDADHGFGRHSEAFETKLDKTCESALADGTPVEKAMVPVAGDRLQIGCLTAPGTSLPAFTSTSGFHQMFSRLRESFDLILVDAPPVQESSDALLLMPEIDGVVLIVQAEKTRWQVARNVCDKLKKQGGTLLGVVLNKRRHYIPQAIYRLL